LTFSWCSQGVPAGTHLLEVVALGYFFSPVMCLSMLLHCHFPLLFISCRTSAWSQPEFCSNLQQKTVTRLLWHIISSVLKCHLFLSVVGFPG
jgi:hypothetical protein